MTREIKFRGKDFLGRWHYGHLHLATGSSSLMIQVDSFDSFGVLPETIGQFTGLHDKNGKEIYEGDIIRSYDSENNPIIHSISWDNKWACYVATMLQYPLLGGSIDQGWIDEFEKEVIGNIHDNPELLKTE